MIWNNPLRRVSLGLSVAALTAACAPLETVDKSPVTYLSQNVYLVDMPKGRGIAADEFTMHDFPNERFCGECWIVQDRIKGGVGLPFADPAKGAGAVDQIVDAASLLVVMTSTLTDLSVAEQAFSTAPKIMSPRPSCRVLSGRWNGHRRTAVVTTLDEVDQDTSACGMVAILTLAGLSEADALDFERFTTYDDRRDKYLMTYAAVDAFVADGKTAE